MEGSKLGDGFSLGVNRMIIHSNNIGAGDGLSGILWTAQGGGITLVKYFRDKDTVVEGISIEDKTKTVTQVGRRPSTPCARSN